MRNPVRLLVLSLLVGVATAANIDCAYPHIRDTTLGTALATTLGAPATPEGAVAIDQPLKDCQRVLITWSGPKAPPVVRFLGVPAEALVARYAATGTRVDSRHGPAYPLPQQPGFIAVALGESDLLIATPAVLAQIDPPEWPEATGNVLDFSGPATDLKLGDLQDELSDFLFAWQPDGKLVLHATANSRHDAKSVLRYISIRKPLVQAAAGVGVDKAELPAKLLDCATFSREDNILTARMDLDEPTRVEAVEYLAKQVRRQMKKYH
jgi:hypothetical protein